MAIDAVITWVDGSDPQHAAKLMHWRERSQHGASKIIEKAAIPHRFADHDEIIYCLRSIRTHAPWIRTIWLVTDDQFPTQIDREIAEANHIRVVDHRHIFRGLEELLPTFNSIAIESLVWRIEGLSEQFILFNDDMFFAGKANRGDFFKDDKVILRGIWADWTTEPVRGHHQRAQRNATKLIRHDLSRSFIDAHAPHPMLKSVMANLYERFFISFVKNAALRFRTNDRVYPPTLFNLEMIATGRAIVRSRKRIAYVTANDCEVLEPEQLSAKLDKALAPKMLCLCINALDTMKQKIPDAEARLAAITGPRQPWELKEGDDTDLAA